MSQKLLITMSVSVLSAAETSAIIGMSSGCLCGFTPIFFLRLPNQMLPQYLTQNWSFFELIFYNPDPAQASDELDANLLAEKLKEASETQRRASINCEDSPDEHDIETEDEKFSRKEFEKRRKLHYNEASAIKLARKLIQEENEDDGEEGIRADINVEPEDQEAPIDSETLKQSF